MNRKRDQNTEMGIQSFFAWRAQPAANEPAITDDEIPADVDEPPDRRAPQEQPANGFHKSLVRPQSTRKESLLTKAFQKDPEMEASHPQIQLNTELTRRRSMISNASLASTAELTSDGGLTSPARTNTPSPPFPNTTYTSFAPYSLAAHAIHRPTTMTAKVESNDTTEIVGTSPKTLVAEVPRKRRITFMCDVKKDAKSHSTPVVVAAQEPAPATANTEAPVRRRCTFALSDPKPSDKASKTGPKASPGPKPADVQKRITTQSPPTSRKSPRPASSRPHRDSNSTIRHVSPASTRAKPKFLIADEETLQSSEATRFHEFACEEVQEDDWIRKDAEVTKVKLTINDTLEKENRIRQLGNEAEEEALEDEEDDDEENGNISDDDGDSDSQEEMDDVDDLVEGSDFEASDGNETDNEAGFAESDDESDAEGEFAFWTPGKKGRSRPIGEASTYRASAHRTASASSIDSLNHMEPPKEERRLRRRRPIKIRPGTPDLPDSTDFVCGTLDEDRPLEDAYVSCMELRKNAKHKQTPQDIDPSFPTSDPEDEEDVRDHAASANDSDEHVWLHGKFEESDDEPQHGRRRSIANRRKSPGTSPRRLHSPPPPRRMHSPPPPKQRLRSPPPRKLFGHSPKPMRSPPPARTFCSPPASPTQAPSHAINFAPLGSRPGLTHTKSLPRTPNAFCRQYQASRLDAATGNGIEDIDGPTRGAIDIVKGLEQKRQRRKEKFYQKHCNRKQKQGERPRPQPGKGAERMRELGLLMAGKTGVQDPYMMSA